MYGTFLLIATWVYDYVDKVDVVCVCVHNMCDCWYAAFIRELALECIAPQYETDVFSTWKIKVGLKKVVMRSLVEQM